MGKVKGKIFSISFLLKKQSLEATGDAETGDTGLTGSTFTEIKPKMGEISNS